MILDITALHEAYSAGITPAAVIEWIYDRIESTGLNPIWISLVPRQAALDRAEELESRGMAGLPLFGVPFAVKDNIDVAGMVTTAGCPAFAYEASESATVVERLEAAGAILIGKTNLDQFATGLVGVRSPYGACSSVFDDRYISGGSSSGSAVAVASGLVSFSLGTDTAGSGRVPAAFNNLIGLKPTRGALSTTGVVPACRSLDCVSIFALTAADASVVFEAARGFDADDPYSRATTLSLSAPIMGNQTLEDKAAPWAPCLASASRSFRFGVPSAEDLEFFGDTGAKTLYEKSISTLEALGGEAVPFDYKPFRDAASLLYSGPWVAERLAGLKEFFGSHADDIHPVVRGIIAGAEKYTAVDAFLGRYRLGELRRQTEAVWAAMDFLLLPTTGTTYTIAEVEADPVRLNTNLGYYTNFVNLLDLAAVALPAGFRTGNEQAGLDMPETARLQSELAPLHSLGLPFGVTLIGPAFTDSALLALADLLHRQTDGPVGGLETRLSQTAPLPPTATPPGCTLLAVVGAHLTGQPLNGQLTERGARLVRTTHSAAGYRLYALPNTTPPKPGLVREPSFDGPGIEMEVWAMPTRHFGSFVAAIPPPLGIGTVELTDGTSVAGFICEPYAIAGASEITGFGGWRGYLKSR